MNNFKVVKSKKEKFLNISLHKDLEMNYFYTKKNIPMYVTVAKP